MPPSRRVVLAALAGTALAGTGLTGCRTSDRADATATPAASAGTPSAAAHAAPTSALPEPSPSPSPSPDPPSNPASDGPTRADIVARYGQQQPTTWGFDAPGVVDRLPSASGAIALTFDACGGPHGTGYDQALIDFLRARRVPATLFLNARWIDANLPVFDRLAADPLFEIANHGTRHCPLSVSGRSAYDIAGTRDAGEVFDEITGNRAKLTELLGRPPRFFRSGSAYLDDVAARIVTDLGERFAGFTVNGDGGATFTPDQVHQEVAAAAPGSIVLAHMNHPAGGTARGMATAVPELLDAGHHFVRLSDGAP